MDREPSPLRGQCLRPPKLFPDGDREPFRIRQTNDFEAVPRTPRDSSEIEVSSICGVWAEAMA